MAETDEVENFLRDFKIKLGIWGLEFKGDRKKNRDTLLKLEITAKDVQNYLKLLKVTNYCSGPEKDTENDKEFWVFGMDVDTEEIYIKINIGQTNNNVICISFHIAEYPLVYPLK